MYLMIGSLLDRTQTIAGATMKGIEDIPLEKLSKEHLQKMCSILTGEIFLRQMAQSSSVLPGSLDTSNLGGCLGQVSRGIYS